MSRGASQTTADGGGNFDTTWVVDEGTVRLWKPTPRRRIATGIALIVGGALVAAAIVRFTSHLQAASVANVESAEPFNPLPWRIVALFLGAATVTAGLMMLGKEAAIRIDSYMVCGSCPGRRRKRRTRWWREDIYAAEVTEDAVGCDLEMRFHLVLVHARGGRWVLVSGSDRVALEQLCATIRALMGLKRGK